MSICLQALLCQLAATAATTRGAGATESDFLTTLLGALAAVVVGVLVFAKFFGTRTAQWSPRRVPKNVSALPLWLIGAVMVWCFLAVPTVVALALRPSANVATAPANADAFQVALYGITTLVGVVVAFLLHAAFRGFPSRRTLGLARPRGTPWLGKTLVAGLIAISMTYLVGTASLWLWQVLHVEHDAAHPMLQLMERNASSHWLLWGTILNATVLAPLFEEVLFRGHFQTALTAAMPRSRWPAILVTSLLFAAIHDAWTAPAIFALSVGIGVAYEWTGSLWTALAIHIAFNALSTFAFLSGGR